MTILKSKDFILRPKRKSDLRSWYEDQLDEDKINKIRKHRFGK